VLNSFGFLEDDFHAPSMTKDNFDGGGLEDALLSPGAGAVAGRGGGGERLPSMHQIAAAMSHHSRYLDVFLRMHNHVLKGDGPLSYELRHFVAMMVGVPPTVLITFLFFWLMLCVTSGYSLGFFFTFLFFFFRVLFPGCSEG
jgi:hypothetical protein